MITWVSNRGQRKKGRFSYFWQINLEHFQISEAQGKCFWHTLVENIVWHSFLKKFSQFFLVSLSQAHENVYHFLFEIVPIWEEIRLLKSCWAWVWTQDLGLINNKNEKVKERVIYNDFLSIYKSNCTKILSANHLKF